MVDSRKEASLLGQESNPEVYLRPKMGDRLQLVDDVHASSAKTADLLQGIIARIHCEVTLNIKGYINYSVISLLIPDVPPTVLS